MQLFFIGIFNNKFSTDANEPYLFQVPIIWFIANCGGILGLCMGFSLITIFEIGQYTLQIVCNKVKRHVQIVCQCCKTHCQNNKDLDSEIPVDGAVPESNEKCDNTTDLGPAETLT